MLFELIKKTKGLFQKTSEEAKEIESSSKEVSISETKKDSIDKLENKPVVDSEETIVDSEESIENDETTTNQEESIEESSIESIEDSEEELEPNPQQVLEEYEKIMEFLNPKKVKQMIQEVEYDFELKKTALCAYVATIVNRSDDLIEELKDLKAKGFQNTVRSDFDTRPKSSKLLERMNKEMLKIEKEQKLTIQALKRKKKRYEFTLHQYKEIRPILECFTQFTFEEKARVVRLMCKHDELSESLDNFFKAHVLFNKTKSFCIIQNFEELSSFLYEKIADDLFKFKLE